jgi:hypothetical protein
MANRSFEKVSQFKSLGMTVTYQNLIQDKIKRRLNSGYAATIRSRTFCLSKNLKIRMFKTIILPVVQHGFFKLGL